MGVQKYGSDAPPSGPAPQAHDVWLDRAVAAGLTAVALAATAGLVLSGAQGREPPASLVQIGFVALGALATMWRGQAPGRR